MNKKQNQQIDWTNQATKLIEAITQIADERKIPRDTVVDALKDAITKAYIKEYPESEIQVDINIDDKVIRLFKLYKVVEEYDDLNDYCEISIKDVHKHDKSLNVGDTYKSEVSLNELSDTSLSLYLSQMFKHNITSKSNEQVYSEWLPKVGHVVFGEVEEIDRRSGGIRVNIGSTSGFVPRNETVPGEKLNLRTKYNFLIKDVKKQTKGWPTVLSRANKNLVKEMMRIQIPELQENRIEIKDIARVAGFKTKVSVISHQPSIDPTGAIIGQRGQRINAVRDLIDNSKNEKIEVIEYSDDFTTYIINVCSPAEISGFAVTEPKAPEDRKQIVLVARDDKLALLIGKRGCNVRLISDLLNADIEIRSVQEAQETNLEYTHIDMSKMRQQGFNKTFNKYKTSNDMFNRYKTAKVNLNYGESEEQIKSKNMKTSILDEFKKMDKKDLDETLSQVDTDNNDDDINDHDEY